MIDAFDTGYKSRLFVHFMVLLTQKVHLDPGSLSPFQRAKSARYIFPAGSSEPQLENLGGFRKDDSLL